MIQSIPFSRTIQTLLLGSLCFCVATAGKQAPAKDSRVQKTLTFDHYRPFINENIFSYYSNNGDGSFNRFTSGSGFEFPKGTSKTAIFEEGVVWGGLVGTGNSVPRVGGSVYRHGLQAGKILQPGFTGMDPISDDPWKPEYRVYRVRPDVNPKTAFSEVEGKISSTEAPFISRYESYSAQEIYDQYIQDWNEWPAADGTPYTDMNGNGTYDPAIDIPGQPGADQTLWYVANDMNYSLAQFLAGCNPIGLEMRRTIWGYNKQGMPGNTIFASTVLINKSGTPVDSMFVVQWVDPDLGNASDDFVGCDTSLSLGYVYNSQATDDVYGTAVPAVGYTFLQGPKVPGTPADSALFQNNYRHGFKNLGMSAFVMFTQGVTGLGDPRQGFGGNFDWYNLMKGRIASSGQQFVDPTTGLPTKFVMAGDPVARSGWIDGPPFAPAQDRRFCLVTGPFTFAANDTQEIVVATTAALGTNYLNSISVLKSGVARLRGFVAGGIVVSIAEVDTLYPAHVPITLKGSGATFGGVASTLEWTISSKPAGSQAIINLIGPGQAQIAPDTPGVYTVRLVGSTVSGLSDTAYVTLNVTGLQRPIAAFSVPSSVTLGDTVTIDGSASYDPNGFGLTRTWDVTGSRAFDIRTPRDSLSGYLSSTSDPAVRFVPLRSNLHTVRLTVSNAAFTTSLVKTFEVKPLTSLNVSINRQLASGVLHESNPNLSTSGYYFWSPIKEFDGHIWVNDGGLCAALDFGNLHQPGQVYPVDGYSFDGYQNLIAGSWSNYATLISTNGQGMVESTGRFQIPFPRVNADTAISAPILKPPYMLLPCGTPGILIVDISYPGYPSLAKQYSDGQRWGSTFADGTLLYGIHPATNKISVVNLGSLPDIAPVALITLDKAYTSITKIGQYFYLIKTDTIAIYDLTNPGQPVVKGYIEVPKTFNLPNRFNAVAGFGNTIIASTAEGVYLFDVSNTASPSIVGSLVTGSYFSSVFMNASHMLAVNLNRGSGGGWDAASALEGLLELKSPFTGVGENTDLGGPNSFCLEQNYPNPFNPTTVVSSQLPVASNVKLVVYNVLGQEVAVLVNERRAAGSYQDTFDASNLASGVYIYRLTAGNFVQSRKMVLLK